MIEMTNPNKVAEAYLAAWNEPDATERRALIEQAWAAGATYRDPMMEGDGHEAISAMIGQAQAQFPGLRFGRAGEAQTVGRCIRFSWHLAPEGGEPVAGGTDFCVLAPDGRLQSVTGFLDFAPSLPI